MAMSSRILPASAAAALLAGCTNTVHSEAGFGTATVMGETARYNAAVQIIDPAPVYDAADSQPGDRGDKGAAAVKRYRTDAVKQVEAESTGSGAGGSGPQ
jgi:hypothetical protein